MTTKKTIRKVKTREEKSLESRKKAPAKTKVQQKKEMTEKLESIKDHLGKVITLLEKKKKEEDDTKALRNKMIEQASKTVRKTQEELEQQEVKVFVDDEPVSPTAGGFPPVTYTFHMIPLGFWYKLSNLLTWLFVGLPSAIFKKIQSKVLVSKGVPTHNSLTEDLYNAILRGLESACLRNGAFIGDSTKYRMCQDIKDEICKKFYLV